MSYALIGKKGRREPVSIITLDLLVRVWRAAEGLSGRPPQGYGDVARCNTRLARVSSPAESCRDVRDLSVNISETHLNRVVKVHIVQVLVSAIEASVASGDNYRIDEVLQVSMFKTEDAHVLTSILDFTLHVCRRVGAPRLHAISRSRGHPRPRRRRRSQSSTPTATPGHTRAE